MRILNQIFIEISITHQFVGKLPKAFKLIPVVTDWEELLFLTNPDEWSPQAVLAGKFSFSFSFFFFFVCSKIRKQNLGTKIFMSNLNVKLAQRFLNWVLLPRIRREITERKNLSFQLYLALKKSLWKPAAFYKGILLPLCDEGDCTLRQATIISSIIKKASIPVLHSSAAILKIASMDYSGANSLFLQILLNKKYALPYKVIDSVVLHFLQFKNDTRALPVLWHQSFLVFIQR